MRSVIDELVELVGFPVHMSIRMAIDIPVGSHVFPSHVWCEHGVTKQSTLAKLKERRALQQVHNMEAL